MVELLLAEAFTTAAGTPSRCQPGQHAADAAAAGLALVELLDSPETLTTAVCCSPQGSFNLLAAMAYGPRYRLTPASCADVLVVAARPQPKP